MRKGTLAALGAAVLILAGGRYRLSAQVSPSGKNPSALRYDIRLELDDPRHPGDQTVMRVVFPAPVKPGETIDFFAMEIQFTRLNEIP